MRSAELCATTTHTQAVGALGRRCAEAEFSHCYPGTECSHAVAGRGLLTLDAATASRRPRRCMRCCARATGRCQAGVSSFAAGSSQSPVQGGRSRPLRLRRRGGNELSAQPWPSRDEPSEAQEVAGRTSIQTRAQLAAGALQVRVGVDHDDRAVGTPATRSRPRMASRSRRRRSGWRQEATRRRAPASA